MSQSHPQSQPQDTFYFPDPGGEIEVPAAGFKFGCCDCGMVHALTWRTDGDKLLMRFSRDTNATALLRLSRYFAYQIRRVFT